MLLDIARQTIQQHHLLERGECVVVAVSGGPDSVALLDVLMRLRPEYGLDLHVAHLNHKLRPDADEEAEFVRALAAERDLPVTVEAVDVRALAARDKLSIEHAARNVRREFLLRTARAVGADRIATAHHADDRLETVLLNVLRGTGVDGLAGMRPISVPFIRPFFDATRTSILEYVKERDLPYREDPSNRDPAFLRNRVRWELLPLLEDLQPGCKRAILRLSELAQEDILWMLVQAQMNLIGPTLVERTRNMVTLRLSSLSRILYPALKRRVVREALRLLLGDTTDIQHNHVEAVLRLAAQGKTGSRLHLPHNLVAERGYGTLILRKGKPKRAEPAGEYALAVPGETEIPPLGITVTAELLPAVHAGAPTQESPNTAQLDYAALAHPLILRTWRRGDRFQPLGMTGTMKVHDFFVNQKVPRAQRGRIPIITSGGNIAWIVGQRIDERFKVTPTTETVLRLEVRVQETVAAK